MQNAPFVLVDENNQPLTPAHLWPELTARQAQVAVLLAQGFVCKEIATQLGMTVKTADSHRMSVLNRLGVDNTVKVCLIAVKRGAVTP